MANILGPHVDVILLTRDGGALHPEVDRGLRSQQGVQLSIHRKIGTPRPEDCCRYETIARARNEGKLQCAAPWVMYVDDDVALDSHCVATLLGELRNRPAFGALAADYLGEHRVGSRHVAMGATLFRREALRQIHFRWRQERCECQCCCDDLRRLRWGIDYCPSARALHLPKGQSREHGSMHKPATLTPSGGCRSEMLRLDPATSPSVCLVICFFGPPPGWIHYYLQSCAFNPTIDFLILTDQKNLLDAPSNVRVQHISPAEFDRLATEKTGINVALSHPRKLCDFKPAYGHLFEDLLAGWDYWGYGDLDVIYGDLRRFLSQASLHMCDIFTARREYLVGHFTLFRNSHEMRRLYQQSADLQKTLQSPQVLSFDECGRQWRRRFQGKPLTHRATCDSISHVVQRLIATNQIAVRFLPAAVEWTELDGRDWRLRWEAGRLWVVDPPREAMYFHFHTFKDSPGYRDPQYLEHGAGFEITSAGFSRTDSPTAPHGTPPDVTAKVHDAAEPQEPSRASGSSHPAAASARSAALAPQILATFNRRHRAMFHSNFLRSLRASGNDEIVTPVAVGLLSSERRRLTRAPNVAPIFRRDVGLHVARRRLIEFANIVCALPPDAPVAYWDAGDVIFQSRLDPLWDSVGSHPGKLLAVREPSGYPQNPAVVEWTDSISDASARREAQDLMYNNPFINSGFLAGTARALTEYFRAVAHWYEMPKLAGSTDPGDQLALNIYCHTRPDVWRELPDDWNYCLWGRDRSECYRCEDGLYLKKRDVPIPVVHGNAGTLTRVPIRPTQVKAYAL